MNPADPRAQRTNTRRWQAGATALVAFAVTGCILGSRPTTVVPPETSFGAALAHITVENGTPHRLTIAFQPAAGPGREVAIGTVEPGGRHALAPVPAGEAIILIARASGVGELALAPQSFTLGQRWVWSIPADAKFREGDGR